MIRIAFLLACATPPSASLSFAGVESVRWDGEDGLSATWSAAVGGEEVAYSVTVTGTDGDPSTVETIDTEATIPGLADGEYDVRVTATVAGGSEDGGITLRQLVGEDRFVPIWQTAVTAPRELAASARLLAATTTDASQGSGNWVRLFDLSAPDQPVESATLGPFEEPVLHLAIDGNLLFVATHAVMGTAGLDPSGVRIYDVADPAAPVLVSAVQVPEEAHHVAYENGSLWITEGEGNPSLYLYDLSDPAAPALLDTWDSPDGNPDEVAAVFGRAWVALVYGFTVATREGDSIVESTSHTFPADTTPHNVLPLAGGDFLVVAEEQVGGSVSLWDLRGPVPTHASTLLDSQAVQGVMNLESAENHLYLSAFDEGLMVFDLADPTTPGEAYVHAGGTLTDCALAGEFVAFVTTQGELKFVRFYPLDVHT